MSDKTYHEMLDENQAEAEALIGQKATSIVVRFEGRQGSGKTLLSDHVINLLAANGFTVSRRLIASRRRGMTDDHMRDDILVESPVAKLLEMKAAPVEETETLAKEQTFEGGVIRLARWPEGYVLWFHGKIVWRSWEETETSDPVDIGKQIGQRLSRQAITAQPSTGETRFDYIRETAIDIAWQAYQAGSVSLEGVTLGMLRSLAKAIKSMEDWGMTEEEGFALEAAEQLCGIETVDDDATVYIATRQQIAKLVLEMRHNVTESNRRFYDKVDVKELVKDRIEKAVWPHGDGTLVVKSEATKIALEAAALAVRERIEPFKVNQFIDDELATLMVRFDGIPHWQEQKFVEQEVGELAREAVLRVIFDKQTLIDNLMSHCHAASASAGWWTDLKTGESLVGKRNKGELLMLMVSEIAEAMEAARKNLESDKLPGFSGEEEELADLLIRLGDYAGAHGLRIGEALIAKMRYNAERDDHKLENRRKPGGKAF